MICQVNPQLWFGDKMSPFEFPDAKCIINVAHNLRRDYFRALTGLPYTTLYVRLAKKDREDVDLAYIQSLEAVVNMAVRMKKLPILTHCRIGGHRGPTSALVVAWAMGGKTRPVFESVHQHILTLCPRLVRGRNYYQSTIKLLQELSLP